MGYIGSLCYTTKWFTLVCVLYDKMVYIGPCVIRQNGLHWSLCYMTKWFTLVLVLYDKMVNIGLCVI